MRHLATLAIVLLSGVAATSVDAADLIAYPTSTAQQLPLATATSSYDWNGFYTGVFGAYQHDAAGGDRYGLGADAGVNTTFNFVLAGAEVAIAGLSTGGGVGGYAEVLARGGVLVTDNTLLYGAAGYGIATNGGAQGDLLAGGGLEYAINNAVSLRAQYLHGFPIAGSNAKDQVTLGAQFHF